MQILSHEKNDGEGATSRLLDFSLSLRWDALDEDVRHSAKRHLLDTIGVIIQGSTGEIAGRAESVLSDIRPAGNVPVPGRARRADILDAAYLAGTAGHGIELDDGYRQGSVHPAVCVIPSALYAAYGRSISGLRLLESIVTGYEVMTAIAFASHPAMRHRGFHPTGVVGVFGAVAAAARLFDLDKAQLANAFGIAASGGAGLFAFINGGTDIKRLHAGHAAREGLQAALLARAGVGGPPNVIEGRDGFMQAFAYGETAQRALTLPPEVAFRITDCYIKPYACCRHLQPAVEALITLLEAEGISEDQIKDVRVETYGISAAHARTGWDEYASAQLSFPYIMALGMRYRKIKVAYFEDQVRNDPTLAALCGLVRVEMAPDLDARYPDLRPARVTVTTDRGVFKGEASEALGSRQVPFSDEKLGDKFMEMVAPVIGEKRAGELLSQLWQIEDMHDITPLLDACTV
ncbi:MAG: MmgE/PrpD family protein [Alphaproteobacteria bacterium]|nr:MmgE/PrpD family protein [Alphaproteobacteria bacterium]